MRTTIELSPEHRSRLIALAARRGEKGFSRLIAEALERYFADEAGGASLERALRAAGSVSETEAERWRAEIRRIRERWR